MLLMVAMLLTTCSDHSGEGSDEKGDCFLNIYVYAPEHPMLTRADVGTIASRTAKEHEVKTLQIWVFKHSDGGLVGYLEAKPTFLNETPGQEKFQIKVLDKVFADHPENVDVYVVANAGSCGLATGDNSLKERTKREELDAAMIGEGYFGVNTLVSESYMQTEGLPMSGILKNQSIYGSYPTLRVGTQDAMATLQLTRAVSKLRFVICRKTEKENAETTAKKMLVSIDKIQLDGEVIPEASYLMPVEKPSYTSYVPKPIGTEPTPINFIDENLAKSVIPEVPNPMIYIYESQTAQAYEKLINEAVGNNKLMELGPTYFRESDKKLTGKITYKMQEREKVGEGWTAWETKEKTATFSMVDKGDFLRNHSWIVYVFYMDATIYVLTVTNIGMKVWASGNFEEREVYNW